MINKLRQRELTGKPIKINYVYPLRDTKYVCYLCNQKIKGLEKGQYVVEISELNGLGFCTSEEEIEVLYEMLTKQSIYK